MIFNSLRDEGITKNFLANQLSIPKIEVEKLVFGLATVVIDGDYTNFSKDVLREKPTLKLVK